MLSKAAVSTWTPRHLSCRAVGLGWRVMDLLEVWSCYSDITSELSYRQLCYNVYSCRFVGKGGQRENTSENNIRDYETSLDHIDPLRPCFPPCKATNLSIYLLAGSLPIKLMTLRSSFSIQAHFSFPLFQKALLDIFRDYHLRERVCSVLDQD
jgi:hypothetical protein